ncbi:MAG: biotin--[acetyl-CoA-carboxylase] ligase [Burkholderiaceae bacterium]
MMSEPTLHWGAEALWQQLAPLLPGLSVEVVPSTMSTNSTLLDRARLLPQAASGGDVLRRPSVESAAFGRRAIDVQPCLLVAEQQLAGRGRQGRAWQSDAGASLTFSLGLPLDAPDWSGLSLAVGVALCEALDPPRADNACGLRIGLKWPNDLWLIAGTAQAPANGRKLGGILIETVAAGSLRLAIIGIGLNVLPFDTDAVNTGFASLSELDPDASAPNVLSRLALPLVQALKQFEREGFAAFADRFAARDLLRDQPVRTTLVDAPEGIARGISASGALMLQTPAGMTTVSSGEVSVRPSNRP